MGRPKSPDGAQSVIEQLYPEANAVTTMALVNKLKAYGTKHTKTVWPEGTLGVETSVDKVERVYYPETGHCFIKNLLELDALLGGPKHTKEYLHTKDRERHYRKKLTDRIEDLRWRAHQYAFFAENGAACIENLLSNKDPQRENLFDFTNAQEKPLVKPSTDLQQDTSFIALQSLEKIEIIERDQGLSEENRFSQLAILYLESGNIRKALDFSNKALAIDDTCGYAWMVKGYLAVEGVQHAYQDAFLHQELGTSGVAITAEEMYHQQRVEDASEKAEENISKTTVFLLNAWRYWPKNSSIYICNSYNYEHKLIAYLFKNAKQDRSLDKKQFKTVLEQKRESLDFFATFHNNTRVLLSFVIPVIQIIHVPTAEGLARTWMKKIENSVPYNDYPNPPVAYEDHMLMAAGNNFSHMGVLFALLSYEVVDGFSKQLNARFTEAVRMYHLKSASESYLDALNRCLVGEVPNYPNGLEICNRALNSLQFMKKPFDNRLKKQWQYMQLKMVVTSILKGFSLIFDGPPDDCQSIATFLLDYATTEILQNLTGDEYFEKMEDYDDASPDSWLISFDLTRDQCHILGFGAQRNEKDT